MTLKQAFTEWSALPKNTAQAATNRSAVNQLLLKKYGEMDVREFTAFRTRKIFDGIDDGVLPSKVRTASILVQVLNYASEKGKCLRPEFGYDIYRRPDSRPTTDEPHKESVQESAMDPKSSEDPLRDEFGQFRKGNKPWNAEGSKPGWFGGGRKKVAVVQLHPDTLEVVARFDCMANAMRSTGVANIYRALHERKMNGGYYWCLEGEEKNFKPDYKKGPMTKAWSRRKKEDNKGCVETPTERGHAVRSETGNPNATTTASLSLFSDDELKDELSRRGWYGTLYKRLDFQATSSNNQ